ncbi:MAG: preprotein translocase subunit SecE [Clostridia bacterium]|nr:preprotein translocase subunit SecE [Clostridia bacterium]
MAKQPKLDMPEIEAAPAKESEKKVNKTSKKPTKKRRSIGKFFRDIISELKKVSWASFKRNKDNSGVLGQTGVVLLVTLFFMVVIALFDTGLMELLKLLLNAA